MSDIKQTTCGFCRNGCKLGISFNGYQYRIEYLTDAAPNYGRLCPRGNSTNIVIDHPKRLAYPLLDGKEITWDRAFAVINEWRSQVRPAEMAVVYSRGLTEEEVRSVYGLAAGLKTENLVCGYLDSDNAFFYRLEGTKSATLEDIAAARTILLAGDVFSTSPVAAKGIIEARYADRQSRLVVIDSIKTQQAGFAHLFIQPRAGTEDMVILALAALLDQKLKLDIDGVAKFCGVARSQLEEAAKILKGGSRGFVGCAATTGRVREPFWYALLAQLVALKVNMPFAGFGEALLPPGKIGFGKFREAVGQGKIRMVLWFGALHPYSYPEIFPELNKVEFRVATSIFRLKSTIPGLVLPVPGDAEKEGMAMTLWGSVVRNAVTRPLSGTKPIGEIAGRLGTADISVKINWSEQVEQEFLSSRVEGLLKRRLNQSSESEGAGWLLVGEKRAIGIAGFFDPEEELIMHPDDARKLTVCTGDIVRVKSRSGENSFRVQMSSIVSPGVVSVGVNRHENRALFSVEVDDDSPIVKIPPTKVEIWRA